MLKFEVTNETNERGESFQGYVIFSYKDLEKVFGPPNSEPSGDGKVSTQWTLKSSEGDIITVYDYKMTNLFEPNRMSVEDFRNLNLYEWHVGGLKDLSKELVEYITYKLKN